jgi:mannobiose 2-epimerase
LFSTDEPGRASLGAAKLAWRFGERLRPFSPARVPGDAGDAAIRLRTAARRARRDLVRGWLPWWAARCDREAGGFRLPPAPRRPRHEGRSLIGQARLTWTFAHCHDQLGALGLPVLDLARHGGRYLAEQFIDPVHGGVYWAVGPAGVPANGRKLLQAQSMAILALAELGRASGDAAPLSDALALFRTVESRMRDPFNGGYVEHFERDWAPYAPGRWPNEVDRPGLKSGNAILHVMEAYTTLAATSGEADVFEALERALTLGRHRFYPHTAPRPVYLRPDWSPAGADQAGEGHFVEFAWLMVEAERVLGREPSLDHFHVLLDEALDGAFDWARGGLMTTGAGRSGERRMKLWWEQGELVAALVQGLSHRPGDVRYADALLKTLAFCDRYLASGRDRVWLERVRSDGRPLRVGKAHNWKAAYHETRAMVKLIRAFV